MDAIDILGSLLGHKSSRPGPGTDILKDMFGRGRGGGGRSRSTAPPTKPVTRASIERDAEDLEDLLNVANDRDEHRRGGSSTAPRSAPQVNRDFRLPPSRQPEPAPRRSANETDQAQILVRAMVSAAKSDGQISQSEQQSILARLGDTSNEAIQFLRTEFQKPVDVRGLAWDVPIGMEQQVYTLSLIAIDLDTNREANYLRDLAHGLRLSDDVVAQLHQRMGAPALS